jgi:hypothetical protein
MELLNSTHGGAMRSIPNNYEQTQIPVSKKTLRIGIGMAPMKAGASDTLVSMTVVYD